jgi:hypothetical protein
MVEKVTIGKKSAKSSKKSRKNEFAYDENEFASMFSNSMIQSNNRATDQVEEFRKSDKCRIMRDLQSIFDSLEFKENDSSDDSEDSSQSLKFDFESDKGYDMCKGLLKLVEKLYIAHNLKVNDRAYRAKFTRAYKMLYE